MRIPTRQREHGLRFNITPLIDVIFLLIIFFLAATHFVRSETTEPVDLPEALQPDEDTDEQPRRLVVTVTADGELHVGGGTVAVEDIEHMLHSGLEQHRADFEVRIRADQAARYHMVEPILLTCARAGVGRVKFAVRAK